MSVQRVASRYAKSLIDLAVERDSLEVVKEDMDSFRRAVESRDFFLFLKSPIITPGKKSEIFRSIFGGKFNEMTSGFFQIILNKGREAYLPEIADEFLAQYKVIKHISSVTLTTAVPLSAEAVAKIKAKLTASAILEDNVEITTAVNPDILGGFVLEFGDRLYDSSVAHKLEKLKKEFGKNLFVKDF